MADSRQDERNYWLDRPANVRKVIYGVYGLYGLLFLIDFLHHRHGHFTFETWTGFYSLFGLAACLGIVAVAMGMRRVLMRREDYYDE